MSCRSACGLDRRANATLCVAVEAVEGVCRHVYRESSGAIFFSLIGGRDLETVTVESAIGMVKVLDNNCFAMCYDHELCRPNGSFCSESGVCSGLFWNKQDMRVGNSYAFHFEGDEGVSNQDSPVMCDSDVPEQLPSRDNGERVDPCLATCHLSIQTPDTCRWVQEANGRCSRLFWENEDKLNIAFSPRAPRSPQLEIESHELFELLKAPSNNCEALCSSVSTCRSSGHKSYCRPNGTCQGLFYQFAQRLVKSELVSCYGHGCNELTPVMCEVVGETPNVLPGSQTAIQVQPVVNTPSMVPASVEQPHSEVSSKINHVPETSTTGNFASRELIHPALAIVLMVISSMLF